MFVYNGLRTREFKIGKTNNTIFCSEAS